MEDYKETKQEFHDSGEMKSHTEIKQMSSPQSYHSEIVNMAISIVMAITALAFCSMILIGAMSVVLDMYSSKTERVK